MTGYSAEEVLGHNWSVPHASYLFKQGLHGPSCSHSLFASLTALLHPQHPESPELSALRLLKGISKVQPTTNVHS